VAPTEIQSVGTIYSYSYDRSLDNPFPQATRIADLVTSNLNWFSWSSFSPLDCVFNKFHVMGPFGNVNTWSKDGIQESLTKLLEDAELANHFGDRYRVNRLNIGIGELIAGWSHVVTMPRRADGKMFQRVFSSSSLGCTFGMPLQDATSSPQRRCTKGAIR